MLLRFSDHHSALSNFPFSTCLGSTKVTQTQSHDHHNNTIHQTPKRSVGASFCKGAKSKSNRSNQVRHKVHFDIAIYQCRKCTSKWNKATGVH